MASDQVVDRSPGRCEHCGIVHSSFWMTNGICYFCRMGDGPLKKIKGVGPDTPTTENEAGGKQSALPYRFDLIDAKAIFKLAGVLHHGAQKYEPNNWRKIPIDSHLNHALAHIYAYLGGDTQDDHLDHALCRLLYAVAMNETDKEAT